MGESHQALPIWWKCDGVLLEKMTCYIDWVGTQAGHKSTKGAALRDRSFIRATSSGGRQKGRLALRKVLSNQGTSIQIHLGLRI
jgi:hypothetical protein